MKRVPEPNTGDLATRNNGFCQPFHFTEPPVNNSTGEFQGQNFDRILNSLPKDCRHVGKEMLEQSLYAALSASLTCVGRLVCSGGRSGIPL